MAAPRRRKPSGAQCQRSLRRRPEHYLVIAVVGRDRSGIADSRETRWPPIRRSPTIMMGGWKRVL
jgi:hypothetical protein